MIIQEIGLSHSCFFFFDHYCNVSLILMKATSNNFVPNLLTLDFVELSRDSSIGMGVLCIINVVLSDDGIDPILLNKFVLVSVHFNDSFQEENDMLDCDYED